MKRRERYEIITALVRSNRIANQGEIAANLRKHGFKVTQASVSRDLRAMGVVKSDGYYRVPNGHGNEFSVGRVKFDTAGDVLIVGQCISGLAPAIAVRIDAQQIPEIVGTIAGDDTVFIAVKNSDALEQVLGVLSELFDRGA